MSDIGFTHIAITVTDIDRSISFYRKYAKMQVVHRRIDCETSSDVAWISDLIRPFVIVLIKAKKVKSKILPISHLGVACESREEVDRLSQEARVEDILLEGPEDCGPLVGYLAFIQDPDGHTLEISFGQEVGFAVKQAV
jgi:catechol 2,3-dioxygenase-like lactoylglutathione lyase family enzyme